MRLRARTLSLAVDGVDNLRPPHGPCPPSTLQLSAPLHDFASTLAEVGAVLTAVGIHPKTIYTWLAKARAGGRQALLSRSAPGPRRKLADTQLRELADLIITTDPRDHGFAVGLWTREIVRQLIAARFGVPLTVTTVGRSLHALGFSAQRPLSGAEQAAPAAVARWREIEYPTIAAQAKATGGTVYFIDEAGVRS